MRRFVATLLVSVFCAGPVVGKPPKKKSSKMLDDESPPAAEADNKSKAMEHYTAGEDFFAERQFQKAIGAFEKAYELDSDPAYLFNLGLCHEKLQQWVQASKRYRQFLRATPNPDAKRRVRNALDRVNGELARLATVEVNTEPEGAQVVVEQDGGPTKECVSPCFVRMEPGPVRVTVSFQGQKKLKTRTLREGQTFSLDLRFQDRSQRGTLNVNVDVPGARLEVDGKIRAPGQPLELAVGPHNVLVTHRRHRPFRQTIEVKKGKTLALNVDMDPWPTRMSSQSVGGAVTMGVSSALVANGILFGVLALNAQSDAESLAANGPFTELRQQELDDAKRAANRNAIISDVSIAVGAAGLVTGIVVYLLDDNPRVPIIDQGFGVSEVGF